MHAKSLQLCLTLCHPMDCSPPGSPVHQILLARILEWVAIIFSRILVYLEVIVGSDPDQHNKGSHMNILLSQ